MNVWTYLFTDSSDAWNGSIYDQTFDFQSRQCQRIKCSDRVPPVYQIFSTYTTFALNNVNGQDPSFMMTTSEFGSKEICSYYQCENGRCITNGFNCHNNRPCYNHSDCGEYKGNTLLVTETGGIITAAVLLVVLCVCFIKARREESRNEVPTCDDQTNDEELQTHCNGDGYEHRMPQFNILTGIVSLSSSDQQIPRCVINIAITREEYHRQNNSCSGDNTSTQEMLSSYGDVIANRDMYKVTTTTENVHL